MANYLDDLNMTPQQRGLTNPTDIAARNAYDTANAPKINLSTPIDAGKLFQPTANLGTYTPPDTASKVLTTSSAYNDLINQQNTAATEAKTNLTTSTNAISSLKEKLGLQSTRQAELNQEAGLPQRNADYNNYTNDINSINAGIDKRLKDLETNLRAQGVPAAGIENEKNKVKLETAQLLTQKEIARSVAGNDITRLQANIKDQLALEFDPIKAKLEAEQTQFEANKDLYSTAQQQAWQVQFQAKKDEVSQAEQEKNGISDMLTNALSDGVKIPPEVFAEASKSGSLTEALTLLNNNGIQLGDQLDRAYKQAQIAKLYADAKDKKSSDNAINNVSQVDPNSPTYIQDLLKASSGGAKLTGDQTRPISKALTVVNQIDSLSATLKGQETGPIVGILRSNNPYDIQATLIKAQLQSLIPNLARGVYGEVGVLTDNDIANYRKTIGNLKTPQQANDLLLSMTLKTVSNGIDDQLEVAASAGRDVSGFQNTRARLQERIDSINGRIGVGEKTSFEIKTPSGQTVDLSKFEK